MKTRRVIAALLSVLMIFGVFQISASAAAPTEAGMIIEYEPESNDIDFVENHKELLQVLFEGCIAHEQAIVIVNYGIYINDFYALSDALMGVFPELFFIDYVQCSYYNNGLLYSINPVYNASADEAASMLGEFYTKADEYLALIEDGMDDFEKAIVLHDALVLNNEYDIYRYVDNVYVYSSNYTFMVDGWGRCENFAECYAYLLAQVGIKSEIINSGEEAMQHEWMKIQLGGDDYYYNVDLTWDDASIVVDPNNEIYEDVPDKVYHSYFLLSDDAVAFEDHYGYKVINVSDDAYDGYDNLHSLDNPMFYVNGALYTICMINNKAYIATYNHADDSFTGAYEIMDTWSAGGGYWVGNFSGIGMDCGLLYFNGENCVYCYDPVTEERSPYIEEALTDGRHLYGLYVKDNIIYGRAASSPNSDYEYVELGETIHPHAIAIDDEIVNGSVTADKASAMPGETVFLTVRGEKGYGVDSVSVNGEALEPVGGLYSFEMPAQDVTVTAQFEEGKLLAGHSISLNGDIGLNFYYNLTDNQASGKAVNFTWTVEDEVQNASCELKWDDKSGYYKVSCPIPAAEMTYDVKATLSLGENTIEDTYSVVTYANQILSPQYRAYYVSRCSEEQYEKLEDLIITMLDYGAKAQVQFSRNTDHLANTGINYAMQEIGNIDDAIPTVASDMTQNLSTYGLKYKGTSIVFLTKTSMRHYYKIDSTSTAFEGYADNITFRGAKVEAKTAGAEIFFELPDIEAANLDEQYILKIGDTEYAYAALDYVKAILKSNSIGADMKALATATYWYNNAANAYFGV